MKGKNAISNYDKENDILFCSWGGESEHSLEFFDGRMVLDFNKKGEVVAMEIFDFSILMENAIVENNNFFKQIEKKKMEDKNGG